MLDTVYRLVEPRRFEPVEVAITPGEHDIVVRPSYLSICRADQRYYQGLRSADVLSAKLPLALIHEGIGVVVQDNSNNFAPGTRVVMIPNDPATTLDDARVCLDADSRVGLHASCASDIDAKTFCRPISMFHGSDCDGFMQELAVLPSCCVETIPDSIDNQIGPCIELLSVAYNAVLQLAGGSIPAGATVGVWGDGNLGFLVALMLHVLYPQVAVVVMGKHASKLASFTFVQQTVNSALGDRPPAVNYAVECCGGRGSGDGIAQILSVIQPFGEVVLLSVSETAVPIYTRTVLAKGIRFIGCSRSKREDFTHVIELLSAHPELRTYLSALVNDVRTVRSVADMAQAFEADAHNPMGKTIMQWNV
mgnify:CR=1 FL=1